MTSCSLGTTRCYQKINDGAHARMRLICFPFAGDALPVSVFRRWQRFLPPDAAFWAARYPGRAERIDDRHPHDVAGLTCELAVALQQGPVLPTVFFGHSMGALVAFELARGLRGSAHAPRQLIASAFFAPQSLDGGGVGRPQSDADILRRLDALGGTPAAFLADRGLQELMLPALRADFRTCDDYVYSHQDPLDCRVMAMGGSADPLVGEQDVAGWRVQTRGEFQLRIYQGGHFFLFSPATEALVISAVVQELMRLRYECLESPRRCGAR
jgi:surfactin synthase thioesterase subunit